MGASLLPPALTLYPPTFDDSRAKNYGNLKVEIDVLSAITLTQSSALRRPVW
ncbi:hypothetical protein [Nostoc sp.]